MHNIWQYPKVEISNLLSLIPWSVFSAPLWLDNCREYYIRHGFIDVMFHFLPSFAINGCSATQLPGNMTCSFLACNLVPSSMILTVSKHWHAHVLRYHFAMLWCETSEVFKTFTFLTSKQITSKIENGAWFPAPVSGFLIALHCIMGKRDANIVGHIEKFNIGEKRCGFLAWNLSSRMFSTKCLSPGFSRFLSATTTHVAQSLKGTPAVAIPAVETVVLSPPATLTNHSLAKSVPTGNLVATTKHFGKNRFPFLMWNC